MEDVSTFVKLKNLELKKKKETERRERLRLMNSSRKLEREEVIETIKQKVVDKINYVPINEMVVAPMVNVLDLYKILDDLKNFTPKRRKFN